MSKKHREKDPTRIGSLVSVIVNIIILILANIYYTKITFLSTNFSEFMPILNIMIGTSIIVYMVQLVINSKLFQYILEIITAGIGIWGFSKLYTIFPFTFDNPAFYNITRVFIIFIVIASSISAIVNLVKLFTNSIDNNIK